jgi:hypothetical protein
MSPKLVYKLTINNIFTNEPKFYEIPGPVKNCVKAINEHFGCLFISSAGVTNVITRPNIVSDRFKCLEIVRYQTSTKKFRNGEGSKHKSLILRKKKVI